MPNWPTLCRVIGEGIAFDASTPRNPAKCVSCLVLPGDGGFWALTEDAKGKRTLWCKNEFGDNVKWVIGLHADDGFTSRVSDAVAYARVSPSTHVWEYWEEQSIRASREKADAENAAKLVAV